MVYKFENGTNGRFYYIYIDKDMLDGLVLRIVYGGKRVTRSRTVACGDDSFLRAHLEVLSKRRLRRGYVLTQ